MQSFNNVLLSLLTEYTAERNLLLKQGRFQALKRKQLSVITAAKSMLLIGCCFLWQIHSTHAHHWIPRKQEMNLNVRIGPAHILRRQNFTQKMRFHVFYDNSISEMMPDKHKLITNKLIPEASSYFHQTLRVRPGNETIRLQRTCLDTSYFLKDISGAKNGDVQFCRLLCVETKCGPVTVPNEHLDQCRVCDKSGRRCLNAQGEEWVQGKGVKNQDFILYVSSIQTSHCNLANAVAYASYCQQERSLDRPIAGFANICPARLDTDPRHYRNLLATVKHEIYHALGFSAGLFAFFRNRHGIPFTRRGKHGLPPYNDRYGLYQWSTRVVQKVKREKWAVRHGLVKHDVHVIVTPRVKAEVRKHFRCPKLEGAEIENQGGTGTEFTHWEKRLFENEAMTGTYTQNPVFSRITLALMEDTGWYKANYSMAQDLDWGKNLGCVFSKASCKTWMESRMRKGNSVNPYCFTVKQSPLRMRCTHSKLSVGLCNLKKYRTNIPVEYQYFNHLPTHGGSVIRDTSSYGGAVALADYCPFYQKFTLTGTNGGKRETTCTISENSPITRDNFALEYYGPASRCVAQGNQWTARKGLLTRTMLDWGSGCYKHYCDKSGLKIEVGGKQYNCEYKGQRIAVSGILDDWTINGSLVCPGCREYCGSTSGCRHQFEDDFNGVVFFEDSTADNRKNGASFNNLLFSSGLLQFVILRTAVSLVLVMNGV